MADKIYVGIDNKRIEAKGETLEYVLQTQANAQADTKRIENEQQAKEAARQSAMSKLKSLGLTDDEIAALIP